MELPSGFEPLIVELQSTALPAWLRKQVNIIYQNYKNESIFLSLKGYILNFISKVDSTIVKITGKSIASKISLLVLINKQNLIPVNT